MAKTYDEYLDEHFGNASPAILDLLHGRKTFTTKEFVRDYKDLCLQFKSDCNRMYSRWNREDREEFARYFNGAIGWYDWFCKHTALTGRTEKYGSMIAHIVKEVPELGENTKVFFSQRYGNGFVDCFGIDSDDEMENPNPYGYYVRVSPAEDINVYHHRKYYVYRSDRSYGGDYECDTMTEVIAFIKKDLALWKQGYLTKEFDREAYDAVGRKDGSLYAFLDDLSNRTTSPEANA